MSERPLCLFSGNAHPALAARIAQTLGQPLSGRVLDRFPDGELRVALNDDVGGRDVFIIQSLSAPVGDHLLELMLLADAAKRSHARSVTGVVPYFAYARQDRREGAGQPLGSAVLARTVGSALDRLVVVDLHSPSVEGAFPVPVEHVAALHLLAEHVRAGDAPKVVVSPDLGAVKRAERFARAIGAPLAFVHKTRTSGKDVQVGGLVGDVRGAAPIIVDDMISTAGTIEATARVLVEHGCEPEITVCATHGLFVGPARERLKNLPIRRIVVTDSLPAPVDFPVTIESVSIAPTLAETIRRLHNGGASSS